jgi:hypothetical protein
VHSFAGDDWRVCRDHVRERLGYGGWRGRQHDPCSRPPRRPPAADGGPTEAQRTEWALCIWHEAAPIPGTLGERYLASRGLWLDGGLAHVLRFHRRLRHRPSSSYLAAMVALMRDVRTGEPRAIHRTYLDGSGRKVDRMMLGAAAGAAVMMDDVEMSLHVGEGIETCLAARQLGYRPTWAMGSSGGIRDLPVLPGIEALTVLGETDDVSEAAARAVHARYEAAGIEAWLAMPRAGDMNDAAREAA